MGSAATGNRLMIGEQPRRQKLSGNIPVQAFAPVIALKMRNQEDQFNFMFETCRGELIEPRQIKEEKFLRKDKILLQTSGTRKKSGAYMQEGILLGKSTARADPKKGRSGISWNSARDHEQQFVYMLLNKNSHNEIT